MKVWQYWLGDGQSFIDDPGYSYTTINMKEFLFNKCSERTLTPAEHIYRPTWVCLRITEFMTQHSTHQNGWCRQRETITTSAGRMWTTLEILIHCWQEYKMSLENSRAILQNVKNRITLWFSNATPLPKIKWKRDVPTKPWKINA